MTTNFENTYQAWCCGHMHQDIDKSMYKLRVLYNQIAEINTDDFGKEGDNQ